VKLTLRRGTLERYDIAEPGDHSFRLFAPNTHLDSFSISVWSSSSSISIHGTGTQYLNESNRLSCRNRNFATSQSVEIGEDELLNSERSKSGRKRGEDGGEGDRGGDHVDGGSDQSDFEELERRELRKHRKVIGKVVMNLV
jgi:hypothetical protein